MVLIVPRWVLPYVYGLTIWKLILVREYSRDIDYVIEHEKIHVKQWAEIGFFKFPYLYIKELIKVGYYANKYEVEARYEGLKNSQRIK